MSFSSGLPSSSNDGSAGTSTPSTNTAQPSPTGKTASRAQFGTGLYPMLHQHSSGNDAQNGSGSSNGHGTGTGNGNGIGSGSGNVNANGSQADNGLRANHPVSQSRDISRGSGSEDAASRSNGSAPDFSADQKPHKHPPLSAPLEPPTTEQKAHDHPPSSTVAAAVDASLAARPAEASPGLPLGGPSTSTEAQRIATSDNAAITAAAPTSAAGSEDTIHKEESVASTGEEASNHVIAAAQHSSTSPTAAEGDAVGSVSQASSAATSSAATLSRRVADELRAIHAAAATIANFTAVHINRAVVPRPADVQDSVNRALSITQALTSLLSSPDVLAAPTDEQSKSLYDFSAPTTPNRAGDLNILASYSPYGLSALSSGRKRGGGTKQSAPRKRRRSGETKSEVRLESDLSGSADKDVALAEGQAQVTGSATGGSLHGPSVSAGSKPDGESSLSGAPGSPGGDSLESKGPLYKKRSRAHAQGSCTSCGSADTPEWRRGPDGARTLCNACGLHYAKLVRNRQRSSQEGLPEGAIPLVPPPPVTVEELRESAKAHNIGGTPSGTPSRSRGTNGSASRSGPHGGDRPPSTAASRSRPEHDVTHGSSEFVAQSSVGLPQLAKAAESLEAFASATRVDDASIAPQLRSHEAPPSGGPNPTAIQATSGSTATAAAAVAAAAAAAAAAASAPAPAPDAPSPATPDRPSHVRTQEPLHKAEHIPSTAATLTSALTSTSTKEAGAADDRPARTYQSDKPMDEA